MGGASLFGEILPSYFCPGAFAITSQLSGICLPHPGSEGGRGPSDEVLHLSLTFSTRYFLTSFYTKYDQIHFILNTVSLMSVLIPKLPQLHGVRIFGINKY